MPQRILRYWHKNLASFITKLNDRHVAIMEDLMSFHDELKAYVQLLGFKSVVFKSSASIPTPIVETYHQG